ncbi:MAG TPA: hypothetical protein VK162_19180 [Streptosporangiaceae bacterium]|nr:hypothetical protein [Streptosporangiaceae bacterium]
MATSAPPTSAPPTSAPCWPEDPDWLDGPTEIELSKRHLRACWDADLIDIDDKNKHDTIIERKDAFEVRFRVQLEGRLWKCICGCWCFDLCFDPCGEGTGFNLSGVLTGPELKKLHYKCWKGCDTRCIYVCVRVPPETIPAGNCGTLYDVGAKFELRCCDDCDDDGDDCGGELAVAGHEHLGEYMFT